jgi:hypothetical protein
MESVTGRHADMRSISGGKAKQRFRPAAKSKLHGCSFDLKFELEGGLRWY